MKNIIVVTGGAGFIGSNLIKLLVLKTNYRIISMDNYSTGSKRNHIKNKRVKYLRGENKNIFSILKNKSKRIKTIFHFGEFSRIYQSFIQMNKCFQSNTIGTNAVFNFCLKKNIDISRSIALNEEKVSEINKYSFPSFIEPTVLIEFMS